MSEAEDEFVAELRSTLRSPDPTAPALLVSSILSVTDAWRTGDDELDSDPIPLDDLIGSFADRPFAETTAVMHLIAAFLPDDLDAARVRRALAGRRHPVPEAVLGVRDIDVRQAAKIGDELGDGDNILLGLGWPGIGGATVVTYVDEAFGTRVKDVFVLPEPFDDVCDRYRALLADSGRSPSELHEVTTADARASIQQAIDLGDAPDAQPIPDDWSGPDGEPNGWPGARPFIEFLLRRMPGGGASVLTSSDHPEMSVIDAVEGFLGSAHARSLGDLDGDGNVGQAAAVLAIDAAEWSGHPLRWSPVQVELALSQRLPWAPEATEEGLNGVAAVMPAYIRYAHELMGVHGKATSETLAAVDHWLPTFEMLRRTESAVRWRRTRPMVEAFERGDTGPLMLHSLAEEVGGIEALEALDAEPLPPEPLQLDGVPVDLRETAAEVAALVDAWLETSPRVEHLGPVRAEWRTAAHRMLVGAATRDPGWLRRRAAPNGRACALLWATGIANRLVGPYTDVLVKDLGADFGISGAPSARAESLLSAWGADPWRGPDGLGDAGLLVSSRRARIIEARDRYRA